MTTLKVTIIQTSLFWEDKASNLQMLEQKIWDIPGRPELVVLPEMFSTGFSMDPVRLAETMEGPSVAWMKKTAAERKIILTGSLIIEEDGRYFNRLLWMLPNGQCGHYDKRHLFAYGGEDQSYSPGHKRLIASVNGWKIHLLICYDLRFPVWSRQSPQGDEPEYDLLVYVANWPQRRSHAWKTLLQARAIENQCYVVGVNRTGVDGNQIAYAGDSVILDPLGQTVHDCGNDPSVVTCELHRESLEEIRTQFPFLKDADSFILEP